MPEFARNVPLLGVIALGLTVASTLAVFVWLCGYARPSVDDYIIAYVARDEGLIGSQLFWYREWTGKFTGMLFMSAFPLLFDLVDDYWLAPALVIVTIFGALWSLVRSVPGALTLLAVYLASVPAPRESIYWLTGAYAYQLGAACAILLLASVARNPLSRRGRVANVTAAAIFAACATASSETMLMPLAVIAGAWGLGAASRQWAWSVRGVVLSAVILLSAGIVVLAPGNEVRGAHFVEHSHLFWRSVGRSFETGGKALAEWSLNPALIGVGVLFAPGLVALRERVFPGKWLPVVGYLIVLASVSFPAFWAMGYPPPPRGRSAVWSVFAVGWLVTLVPLVAEFFRARGWVWSERCRMLVGSVLIAIGLLAADNTRQAMSDLSSGDAQAFHREAAARDGRARAARARGETTVVIPRLRTMPPTLFVQDLEQFMAGYATFHRLEAASLASQ